MSYTLMAIMSLPLNTSDVQSYLFPWFAVRHVNLFSGTVMLKDSTVLI